MALHRQRNHAANAIEATPTNADIHTADCPKAPQAITPATNGKSNLSNGTRDNAERYIDITTRI